MHRSPIVLFAIIVGVVALATIASCRRSDPAEAPLRDWSPNELEPPDIPAANATQPTLRRGEIVKEEEIDWDAMARERAASSVPKPPNNQQSAASSAATPATAPAVSLPPPADLPELVARVKPYVVTIIVYGPDDKPIGQGTGFWLGTDRIVTNHHVVAGGARAEALDPKHDPVPIRGVLASDSGNDLVLLAADRKWMSIDEAYEHDPMPFADKLPRQAEQIVVIGSPQGLEHTVSTGIVSSIRPSNDGQTQLQITAPISHGSSGSPVLDMQGRVVGVAVSVLEEGQLLNFAVPVTALRALKPGKLQTLSEWVLAGKPAEVALADVEYAARNYENARILYERAEQKSPSDPIILSRLGWCYVFKGSAAWGTAESYFKKAIALGAHDPEAFNGLSVIYSFPGTPHYAPQKAVDVLHRGLQIHRDDAGLHASMAKACTELQRHDDAIVSWREATRLAPKNIYYLKCLGDAFRAVRKEPDAVAAYRRAVAIEPAESSDYLHLGNVFEALGNLAGARQVYERGLLQNPDFPILHAQLGWACLESDPDKAADHIETAARGEVDWVFDRPNSSIEYAYRHSSTRSKRIAMHKAAIRANPNDPYPHLFLGILLTIEGDSAGALAEYQILKRLNPDLAESLFKTIYP